MITDLLQNHFASDIQSLPLRLHPEATFSPFYSKDHSPTGKKRYPLFIAEEPKIKPLARLDKPFHESVIQISPFKILLFRQVINFGQVNKRLRNAGYFRENPILRGPVGVKPI